MLLHSLFMWPEHPHCQWNQFKLISFIMYTTQQSTSIMDPNQIRGNSVIVLNANCVDFAIMPFQAWQSKRDTATAVFFFIFVRNFTKLSLVLINADSSKTQRLQTQKLTNTQIRKRKNSFSAGGATLVKGQETNLIKSNKIIPLMSWLLSSLSFSMSS